MPRQVDHGQRRDELVDATLRVIEREGFAAASVRRVATEAGWSTGSLRHYFPQQDALVEAALVRVTEAAATRLVPRIIALERADRREVAGRAVALLEELLPLDAARRGEWALWNALVEPAAPPARLATWRRAGWLGARHQCRRVVARLADPAGAPIASAGVASGDGDTTGDEDAVPEVEAILASVEELTALPDPTAEARAAGLHALVDGLALHLVTFPDEVDEDGARSVLVRAVDDLAAAVARR